MVYGYAWRVISQRKTRLDAEVDRLRALFVMSCVDGLLSERMVNW